MLTIKTRLLFALSMLLGLMASQVIITVTLVTQINNITTEITGVHLKQLDRVNQISTGLVRFRMAQLALVLAENPQERTKAVDQSNQMETGVNVLVQEYRKFLPPMDKGETGPFMNYYTLLQKDHQQLLHQVERQQLAAALGTFYNSQDTYTSALDAADKLRNLNLSRAEEDATMSRSVATHTKSLLTLALLIAAIIEIALGLYLGRSISNGLSTLLNATHRVAQGDLSYPINWTAPDEFGQLTRSFNFMLRSLINARQENTLLHQSSLQMSDDRIRLLRERLSQVVKAQEDERQRVARELHDQAGQVLTAINLGLGRIEKLAESTNMKDEAASLRALTISTMDEIRNLARDLRPSMLDELGLIPAIRQYAKEFSRRTDLPVTLKLSPLPDRLPTEFEITVFRVIQEGLTNIAKHACATEAKIIIAAGPDCIHAQVEDNGVGFNVNAAFSNKNKKSLGLFGIQERLALIGGPVDIQSTPGDGTVLSLTIPLLAAATSSA
ncbi:MAG: sensor histidine kinase [Bacillota bacterium]